MEDDIKFLIGALSEPKPSKEMTCSGEKLQEMRDAFVALQKLLRSNQFQAASWAAAMPRSTAGGEVPRQLHRFYPSALTAEESPESELDSVAMVWSSSESGARTSASLTSLTSTSTSTENLNLEGKAVAECQSNFNSWSPKPAAEVSDPEATVIAQRLHSSTVSVSLPVKLVFHSSHDPVSETTITPDGIRYSLAE